MSRWLRMFAILVIALTGAVPPRADAGLMDAVKKKITDKATKKVDEKTDQALEGNPKTTPESQDKEEAGTKAGTGNGNVSSVSTKFDFVPGDSVMFLDDFRSDELGEFPSRWRLVDGTFEIAELQGERWARCISTSGAIRMKVPASLPEFWTLEFDFINEDASAIALTVDAEATNGQRAWQALFPYSGENLTFHCGPMTSHTPFPGKVNGRHHVAFMARGTALKVYLDRERMASVPDVTGTGVPNEITLRLGSSSKPMIANVRFAEGCRPPKDMLAQGKLVTHGIRFETGSDVVMPESAPILRQVATYLEANPAVRLKITGHTDNVGTPASNLDLSKRRAAAVAKVLSTEFTVSADRFETDGKGDSQPMSGNAKPEGRAMNRRVEFAKLSESTAGR